MTNGNAWTTFDAATQMYRDGLIDATQYDTAIVGAFGEDDAALILGAVLAVLGE